MPNRILRKPIGRKAVLAKTKGRCAYCGIPLGRLWHRDHVVPLVRFKGVRYSFGGRNGCVNPEAHDIDNIVAACVACNKSKGPLDLETWRASLKWPPLGGPVVFYFERLAAVSKPAGPETPHGRPGSRE
jgi:5-methylcytosine-specific restriction endonuclease McrA